MRPGPPRDRRGAAGGLRRVQLLALHALLPGGRRRSSSTVRVPHRVDHHISSGITNTNTIFGKVELLGVGIKVVCLCGQTSPTSDIVVGNISIQHHFEETCALIPRSLTFGYFRLSLSSSCSQLSTVPQSIADSPREGPSGAAVLPESSSSLRPRGGVSGRAGERPRESSGWMEAAAEELLSAEEGNSSQILPLSVSLFRAAGSFLLLNTSDLAGQSARFFSCFISPPSDNGRSLLPQKD